MFTVTNFLGKFFLFIRSLPSGKEMKTSKHKGSPSFQKWMNYKKDEEYQLSKDILAFAKLDAVLGCLTVIISVEEKARKPWCADVRCSCGQLLTRLQLANLAASTELPEGIHILPLRNNWSDGIYGTRRDLLRTKPPFFSEIKSVKYQTRAPFLT